MTDETGGKPQLVCKQVPLDDLAELLSAADECAEDLAAALDHEYADRDTYPSYYRKYERDMAPVRRLRAAVARVRGGDGDTKNRLANGYRYGSTGGCVRHRSKSDGDACGKEGRRWEY